MATDDPSPASHTRLALARAVAAPGSSGHELTSSNKKGPTRPLKDLVEADAVFFVRVAENILAVDFDGRDAEEAAAGLYLRLRELGHPPVLLASGESHRQHVFARVGERDLEPLGRMAKEHGGDVRGSIRPPLTRHRTDGRSRLLLPRDPAEALLRLTSPSGVGLAQGTRKRLHAATTGREDRSRELYRLACGVVNRGWSWSEFELLLTTPGATAHEHFQGCASARSTDAELVWAREHVWPSAAEWVRANPPHGRAEHDEDLDRLLLIAETIRWSGREGPARRAVFLALVTIRVRCGKDVFHASQRELAEIAGIGSRNTVSHALGYLEREGLIRRRTRVVAGPSSQLPSTDSYSFPRGTEQPVPLEGPPSRFPLDLLGHDAFHSRELGKTARYVLDVVASGRRTIAEVTAATGLSRRVVGTQLEKLRQHDLVAVVDGDWSLTGVDFDDVLHRFGLSRRSETQRRRHHAEREQLRSRSRNRPELGGT